MKTGELGRSYQDGEVIIRQGEPGDCMYVIQAGHVEVIGQTRGKEIHIADLKAGEVFGEMALFEQETRSATVRALGQVRVISIDRKGFLRRVHEDPSLAYRILQQLSQRLRKMNAELVQLKQRSMDEQRSFKERRSIARRRPSAEHSRLEKRGRTERRAGIERRRKYHSFTQP